MSLFLNLALLRTSTTVQSSFIQVITIYGDKTNSDSALYRNSTFSNFSISSSCVRNTFAEEEGIIVQMVHERAAGWQTQ
jgi:hypothetical protein